MQGWNCCRSYYLSHFYHSLPESEKERVESLEVFDEFEEFKLKCLHYTLLIATSNDMSHLLDKIGPCSIILNPCFTKDVYVVEPLSLSPDSLNISRCVVGNI